MRDLYSDVSVCYQSAVMGHNPNFVFTWFIEMDIHWKPVVVRYRWGGPPRRPRRVPPVVGVHLELFRFKRDVLTSASIHEPSYTKAPCIVVDRC